MPSTLTFVQSNSSAGMYAAEPNSSCRIVEWCSFVLLCALLMFGPLAFGAVEAWSSTVLHIGAAALVVLWAVRQVLSGSVVIRRHPLMLPSALFAFLICLQFALRIPPYPADAVAGALNLLAYGMIMFAASQLLVREEFLDRFMVVFTAFGFGLALFAAAQHFSTPGKLYFSITPRHQGWVFGPYVNHNHYAGLMELITPIPLVLTLKTENWSKRILFGFATALMVSSVALSGSRGGMIAVAFQLVFVSVAALLRNKERRPLGALLVVAVAVAAMMTWMAGANLQERLESTKKEFQANGDSAMIRWLIIKDSVELVKERPVLGWGLRMFPIAYPKYRTFYTNDFVNEAHNDYVQYLVETGLVGFSIILFFIVVLIRQSIGTVKVWQDRSDSAFRFAALTACIGILAHSFIDFNLQVPGNAAMFLVMCVIAAGSTAFGVDRAYYPIKQTVRTHSS